MDFPRQVLMQLKNKINLRLTRPARISLGYVVAAALWIFASDGLVATLVPDHDLLVRVQAWKGVGFVLLTGLILYALLRTPHTEAAQHETKSDRRDAVLLGLTFLVLAIVIGGFGALAYRHQATTFKTQQYQQQTAIAELKAGQIERWVSWHRQDAELLRSDPDLIEAASLLQQGPAAKPTRHLRAHFAGLLGSGRWAGIGLYAPDGRPLLLEGNAEAPDAQHRQAITATAAEGKTRLFDLHEMEKGTADFHIDFLAPLLAGPDRDRPAGVIVLSADPRESLFRMVQSWPVPSASSETLLVRREGDKVVFMTPLRHAEVKPLGLLKPLAETTLPAARAVLEGRGVSEGVDYRGAPVLAAFQPVSGTAWHIVAKTDTEEVMQPLRQQAQMIFVVVALAIGATGLFVALLWRSKQTTFVARELRSKGELEALARKFDALFQHARDSILLIDPSGRIVEANEAALASYGYSADEIRRLTIRDLRPPEAQASFERDFQSSARPEGVQFETLHLSKDGHVFPVEVSSRPIEIEGRSFRQSIVRDIAERRQAAEKIEKQLKELQQWYATTLDREGRVVELKAEVNELRRKLGEPPRYSSQDMDK